MKNVTYIVQHQPPNPTQEPIATAWQNDFMKADSFESALHRLEEYQGDEKAPKFLRIIRRHESEEVRVIFYP